MITITITIESKPTGLNCMATAKGTACSEAEHREAVALMQLLVDRSQAAVLAGAVGTTATYDPHHILKT